MLGYEEDKRKSFNILEAMRAMEKKKQRKAGKYQRGDCYSAHHLRGFVRNSFFYKVFSLLRPSYASNGTDHILHLKKWQ